MCVTATLSVYHFEVWYSVHVHVETLDNCPCVTVASNFVECLCQVDASPWRHVSFSTRLFSPCVCMRTAPDPFCKALAQTSMGRHCWVKIREHGHCHQFLLYSIHNNLAFICPGQQFILFFSIVLNVFAIEECKTKKGSYAVFKVILQKSWYCL